MTSNAGTPLPPCDELAALLYGLRLPDSAKGPPLQSLTAAVCAGDADSVHAFLGTGSDIEERSIGFTSPLQAAAAAGRLDMVELLLSLGANPCEKPESLVFSPLSAARSNGHEAVARRLVAAIPDLAQEAKALAVVKARGARDPLACLRDGSGHLAPRPGQTAIRQALEGLRGITGRDKKKAPPPEPLTGEARAEGRRRALELVRGGAAAGRANTAGAGGPLLAMAAESGDLDIVEALLEAGARPDILGPGGATPLHIAARYGHTRIVARLLAAGADPNARAADQETPLIAACARDSLESVRLLLAAGANPKMRMAGKGPGYFTGGVHKQAIRALVATAAGGGEPPA